MNSVITLEKKPAGQALNITQNTYSVAESQSATYGQTLKQLVRMGPDIVGVGDCDDPETARIACESAEDAKLVYVAFEADSVNQALAKWLKLVGDRKIIADTLLGIGCQRLLRKLCPECRQAYTPNKELFTKFNINAQKNKVLYRAGKVVYDKHGKASTCEHCQGTGFVGRTAVFETIVLNDDLRKVVRETKSLPEIASQFRKAKMLYLQEQALRKVITGITSVNEMIRVLSPKEPKAKPAQ
jgi:type II secretory ATPase GspE/PulE/Tfp pilus assembly ATPase PilB-like protein